MARERKEELKSPDTQKMLLLMDHVRTMLRRNDTIMFSRLGYRMTARRRKKMMVETEKEALDFVQTLQTLLLYMTEEEMCDYLDGLKHIVTD